MRLTPISAAGLILLTVAAAPVHMTYKADAKALAEKLKPLGLTPKPDPNGLKQLAGQVTAALSEIETRAAANGPGTGALLRTAYELFRPEVGPAHRTAAVIAVSDMWKEARALGAFDEAHKYTGKITTGPDAGKDAVLEYIVPLENAPMFSRDVANVRLVAPSKARAAGAPATPRELAYVQSLAAIAREIQGKESLAKIAKSVPTDASGETKEEALKRWKAEIAANGDAAKEPPNIVLKGQLISTPSKRNGNKWQLDAELTNLSHHATEVEVQCLVIGATWKKREDYLMLDKTEKVQLRSAQQIHIGFDSLQDSLYKTRGDFYEQLTKKEIPRSRANYRGTIWRVTHGGNEITTFATDPALLDMLKPDSRIKVASMMKFFLDPKDWAKPTSATAAK